MRIPKKPIVLGIVITALLFFIHAIFSYYVNNIKVIQILRPVRDILFFPFLLFTEYTYEIYCWLGNIGIFDHGRCEVTDTSGMGLAMPAGPTTWFSVLMCIVGIVITAAWYSTICVAISIRFNRLKK